MVPHFSADQEHPDVLVLRTLRHLDVDEHLVRLAHHQQLLSLREGDVSGWICAQGLPIVAGPEKGWGKVSTTKDV